MSNPNDAVGAIAQVWGFGKQTHEDAQDPQTAGYDRTRSRVGRR